MSIEATTTEVTAMYLRDLRDAVNEALDNIEQATTERTEGDGFASEQTVDYLRGDAYEIEKRCEKATMNIEATCAEAEEEREAAEAPEPGTE